VILWCVLSFVRSALLAASGARAPASETDRKTFEHCFSMTTTIDNDNPPLGQHPPAVAGGPDSGPGPPNPWRVGRSRSSSPRTSRNAPGRARSCTRPSSRASRLSCTRRLRHKMMKSFPAGRNFPSSQTAQLQLRADVTRSFPRSGRSCSAAGRSRPARSPRHPIRSLNRSRGLASCSSCLRRIPCVRVCAGAPRPPGRSRSPSSAVQ
jgi:hypothetical protein